MLRTAFLASFCALALACTAAPTDSIDDGADAAAESAPRDPLGKADAAAAFVGVYEMTAPSTYRPGDVTNLELDADGSYVRGRCYLAGCATWVPETDKHDLITSGGKRYVRFWSWLPVAGADPKPVVADTYEIKKAGTGIKLRKVYGTRWITLAARTNQQLCDETGGTYTTPTVMPAPGKLGPSGCDCGANAPDGEQYFFVAGAGGCLEGVTSSEAACDDTQGQYSDDDATRIGTYCLCGLGRMMTETGCTAI